MSYRMARTLSRIAKLGEKAVARSNCAQNRNILFKCPRWSIMVTPSPSSASGSCALAGGAFSRTPSFGLSMLWLEIIAYTASGLGIHPSLASGSGPNHVRIASKWAFPDTWASGSRRQPDTPPPDLPRLSVPHTLVGLVRAPACEKRKLRERKTGKRPPVFFGNDFPAARGCQEGKQPAGPCDPAVASPQGQGFPQHRGMTKRHIECRAVCVSISENPVFGVSPSPERPQGVSLPVRLGCASTGLGWLLEYNFSVE